MEAKCLILANAEKASNDGFDVGSLFERPGDRGCVVAPCSRVPSSRASQHHGENCLLKDKCCEFEVQAGDTAVGVGKADKFIHDVLRPLETPDVVFPVLVGINSHTPGSSPRGVHVA